MNTLPGDLLDALTYVNDYRTKLTEIATGSVTATAPSFPVCEGLISKAARAGQVLVLVGLSYPDLSMEAFNSLLESDVAGMEVAIGGTEHRSS